VTKRSGNAADGRTLFAGSARGLALCLDEPLSLWGGMDPATGRVIDRRHPQAGQDLAGRIVLMPSGRGSSSSSSVLAEAVRARTAPAAMILLEPDPIVALGAVVAAELYGRRVPVVAVGEAVYRAIRSGDDVVVEAGEHAATVRVASPSS
jgi:predicted aconitase with swiveling domain